MTHFKQLELALLQTDWKSNPALLDEILAADFEEISPNGQVNSREDVVHWLLHKDHALQWSLHNFSVKPLADNWVLTRYIAQKIPASEGNQGSRRTSIWQQQDNSWKMVFHQATKITEF